MNVQTGRAEGLQAKLLIIQGEAFQGVGATVCAPERYTAEAWDGAVSLSQLVGQAVPYESRPAPLDERIRRGALIRVGLVCAYLLMAWAAVANMSATSPKADFFIVGLEVFRGMALFGGYPAVGIGLLDSL